LIKLIQVRAEDGTEFDPLKQWHRGFTSEGQNALVKIKPAQLSVPN